MQRKSEDVRRCRSLLDVEERRCRSWATLPARQVAELTQIEWF